MTSENGLPASVSYVRWVAFHVTLGEDLTGHHQATVWGRGDVGPPSVGDRRLGYGQLLDMRKKGYE